MSAAVAPATVLRGTVGVYQPQLDGLRAVAIMGVLFHHFGLHIPEFFEYGPVSVRLFFALTGYFITLWLWKAEDTARARGVSVWRELLVFHASRLLRIVPPLYLSLLIAGLLGLEEVRSSLGWHVAFLSNFHVMHTGYWPLVTSHLWSLSVQEQFYLLWPMVILLTPRRWFLPMLVMTASLAFGFRLACVLGGVSPVVRWTMIFGSLDSFATGAFVAWLGRSQLGTVIMSEKQRWHSESSLFSVCSSRAGCAIFRRPTRGLPPWKFGRPFLSAGSSQLPNRAGAGCSAGFSRGCRWSMSAR